MVIDSALPLMHVGEKRIQSMMEWNSDMVIGDCESSLTIHLSTYLHDFVQYTVVSNSINWSTRAMNYFVKVKSCFSI